MLHMLDATFTRSVYKIHQHVPASYFRLLLV